MLAKNFIIGLPLSKFIEFFYPTIATRNVWIKDFKLCGALIIYFLLLNIQESSFYNNLYPFMNMLSGNTIIFMFTYTVLCLSLAFISVRP